jgi:hypothetical protein
MKNLNKAVAIFSTTVLISFGLGGCGSNDPVAATTTGGNTNVSNSSAASGTLTLTGTNNSGKTSFAPSVDTCFAVKTAALLNVNCNNLSGVGIAFVLEGSPVKDAIFSVINGSKGSAASSATTMIYSQLFPPTNGTWIAVAGGTVKITDITATSATLLFTGVSLGAVTATTPATGTIVADGSITVGIK